MIAANPVQMPVAPRRNFTWPAIILTLLGAHMILMMVAVFVINRHNTDSIIPDHDQKSAHWDADHAQRAAAAGRLP